MHWSLQEKAEAIIDDGKAQKNDTHADEYQRRIGRIVDSTENYFVQYTDADGDRGYNCESFETFSCMGAPTGEASISLVVIAQVFGAKVSATVRALIYNELDASSIITGSNVC